MNSGSISTNNSARQVHGLRGDRGFSLVEIMVTTAIVGIIAAISVPLYLGQKEKSTRAAAVANLQSMRVLMEEFGNSNGCYNATCGVSADQVIKGTAIMTYLPAFKPGKDDGLKYNYTIRTTSNGTNFVVGAAAIGTSVSAGSNCAAGEMKINKDNNVCGF